MPRRTECLSCQHRRSEEHTSELQSQSNLVCRLLLEKKKNIGYADPIDSYCLHPANTPLASPPQHCLYTSSATCCHSRNIFSPSSITLHCTCTACMRAGVMTVAGMEYIPASADHRSPFSR